MKLIKLALFVALCLCCAGLALGLPKKKNKNNNNKVSNSELEDSDLIPIPDHLLDDYNKNSNSDNDDSNNEDLNEIDMHPENDLVTPNDKVQDGKNLDELPPFGTNTINKSQKQKKKLLLPEVIPSGDPSQFAMPIFLKEPSDTFLIKSKPATLHCRVAHALRVFFQCNSENVEPTSREDHVEPETGVRYTEASVDIHRDLVEEYFQEFHCACVAISGKGSVVSRHALVTNAYLKKHFEVPPYSQQVSRGGQVEMRCHPPKGRPAPAISWLQNDRPIDPTSDKNFIVR